MSNRHRRSAKGSCLDDLIHFNGAVSQGVARECGHDESFEGRQSIVVAPWVCLGGGRPRPATVRERIARDQPRELVAGETERHERHRAGRDGAVAEFRHSAVEADPIHCATPRKRW